MTNKEWLHSLSVGDSVARIGRTSRRISIVKRITKTLIIFEQNSLGGEKYEVKYRKSDGYLLGLGTWNIDYLKEATSGLISEIKDQNELLRLKESLSRYGRDFSRSDIPMLQEAENILKEMLPKPCASTT